MGVEKFQPIRERIEGNSQSLNVLFGCLPFARPILFPLAILEGFNAFSYGNFEFVLPGVMGVFTLSTFPQNSMIFEIQSQNRDDWLIKQKLISSLKAVLWMEKEEELFICYRFRRFFGHDLSLSLRKSGPIFVDDEAGDGEIEGWITLYAFVALIMRIWEPFPVPLFSCLSRGAN